jgi:signal transduction histidine kinase
MPRNTAVFAPTFSGEGVVRSDDIRADPRYGKNAPHAGMPEGHLPVRSYLAVPVVSRAGDVLGGLFFGHKEAGVFSAEHETSLLGLAGQAATAIDNSRLISQLTTLNATLEQRVAAEVAERTLAQEQLRQSQKMEAIGQLTGGIAHDFNNMLAVVIGALNLMQRRLDRGDTNVKSYIEAATEGANRASSLTARLLAFSRQQPLEPASLDANKLVASMTDLLTRTLGEHIRIETVLASGLWRCFVDHVQLESALLNLAVNARDAMPDGGKLTIDTANATVDAALARDYAVPEGQYVMIAVTDSGVGMSQDVMAQAFEPFFSTKGVGKGTGLGLSQVFGFVRQSGGHVKLYSEIGVGTTAKLYMPRYTGPDAARERQESRAMALGDGSEVVLVVEDEERVRAYSIDALKELGYKVLAAEGPLQALAMIERGQEIDLLFTDIVMPDMTGRQLADRALQIKPKLKVLYTTGYTRNAVVHNGVLDAGTAFLQKPFTVDQLAAKVRQVLDG